MSNIYIKNSHKNRSKNDIYCLNHIHIHRINAYSFEQIAEGNGHTCIFVKNLYDKSS